MTTALVTGATSGIGLGFAERLASDGYDLVLVARDPQRLELTATKLATAGVNVEVIVADLGDRERIREVEDRLGDERRPIEMLVNNAGFSANQRFIGGDVGAEQAQIDVMVSAVMRLSHAALPEMVERGRGAVVNVSSIASFLPFSTYSAAKAWVTSFSQSLATELEGTGVRALAVCPGFVRTEFHERAGIDIDRSNDTWWRDVDAVVQRAMEDLRRGRVISVEGRGYRAIAVGTHLLPRDALRRAERLRRSRIAGRRG
ncbi:MAG: SDR family NAD(P)-dependent oxidoreductase [Actinomycetes bacterium]